MAGISGTLTASVVSRLRAGSDGVNARIGAIEAAVCLEDVVTKRFDHVHENR